MSFRVKASVIAFATATAACLLLAPTAMASSHGPVQVTGKQLKAALLPVSDFVSGYVAEYSANSGNTLEHGSIYNLPSMSCKLFWPSAGVTQGFGETAFATDLVGPKSGVLRTVFEIFSQTVYQFASARTATTFLSRLNAKYQSCRSVTASDTKGGTLRWTVHSQAKQRVGGHQALQVVEYLSDSKLPGPPMVTYVLWTVNGADIYTISTQLLNTTSPQPTQSSLTLKLIARVSALR
jgi:PknH-like extracellular domain